jgi:predicted DNA-binding protein
LYGNTSPLDTPEAAPAARDFSVYTIRLPLDLDEAIKAEAARRFEPKSVLVRELLRRGLEGTAAR